MSILKSIAIKTKPRTAMQERDFADITVEKGISGDFRGSQAGRQITILVQSAWQSTCNAIGTDLPWTTRRANLLVDEIDFGEGDVGKTIRIGEVSLEIMQETYPCSLMDQQHQGLRKALFTEWRGGVCCNVITPGSVRVGDQVEID
jgi:MOSC domain-containing protein YiiM